MDGEKVTSRTRYLLGATISLRDTLAYLPPFYYHDLRSVRHDPWKYGARVSPDMHVDQHVARGDGPIIGLEKACRS